MLAGCMLVGVAPPARRSITLAIVGVAVAAAVVAYARPSDRKPVAGRNEHGPKSAAEAAEFKCPDVSTERTFACSHVPGDIAQHRSLTMASAALEDQ